MAEQRLKFKITGSAPLILHNGQTADPLNRYAKALKQISSKRSKTDADFEEMARIEWIASLYTSKGRVCIPGIVWEASLVSAARKLRLGKDVEAGVIVPDSMILEFPHKDTPVEDLWNDEELRDTYRLTVGVRVQKNKVMRTRSMFPEWGGVLEILFNDELLNRQSVIDIVNTGGSITGLCDWRPRYGRYRVEVIAK